MLSRFGILNYRKIYVILAPPFAYICPRPTIVILCCEGVWCSLITISHCFYSSFNPPQHNHADRTTRTTSPGTENALSMRKMKNRTTSCGSIRAGSCWLDRRVTTDFVSFSHHDQSSSPPTFSLIFSGKVQNPRFFPSNLSFYLNNAINSDG